MRRLTLATLAAIAAVATLSACLPPGEAGADDGPVMPEADRAACLAAGGRIGTGGLFPGELCFRPMPDAGQSCTRAGDCEGLCLAETRTCAPVSPMFGCIAQLDAEGREVVICMD
ncbi:MAG: hypothetical protein IT542_04225 [Rubellimicrobium sp.]|nr:hypothetical protein [Rubellimicrobium sp.]